LVDILPEEKLYAVSTLLKVLVEPPSLAESLAAAPDEDEELLPEFAASLECAYASLDQGVGTPHEEVLREFGL
jgi:hypothetical protein